MFSSQILLSFMFLFIIEASEKASFPQLALVQAISPSSLVLIICYLVFSWFNYNFSLPTYYKFGKENILVHLSILINAKGSSTS